MTLTVEGPQMTDKLSELADCAYRIRRYALRMGEVQGQGYIGQALGMAEILAVAYGHALKLRPDDPEWEGRDRFLLSHGHYAIAFYAALIEAGIVPEDELETYGGDDSRLPMSGMATYTPGMEISGGSLGQGLPIAVGMALGLRQKGNPAFVYNCMSDGELDEGSTWEAAMSASHFQLVEPDHAGGRQQPAGRRSIDQGAGLRAPRGQVGGVRLARAACQRQRPAGGARRLRQGAQLWRSPGRASSCSTRRWARACPSSRRARRTTSCRWPPPSGSTRSNCWMPRTRRGAEP